MATSNYDYIIVGGGLSGCVLASRLSQYDGSKKILLIEAGPDTRERDDILNMQVLNLGSDLDWAYQSEETPALFNRPIPYNQGKGLGGGSVINSGGWTRGSSTEYDEWAAIVGDQRWSYQGQLPWLKKSEHWFNSDSPEQHGSDGPIHVSSVGSTGRKYPLSEAVASAWDEVGVTALPDHEQNSGNNIGRAHLCEGRRDGKRQTSANTYPLGSVTILTDALVKKVTLDGTKATGVELADGKTFQSNEVIVAAGVFKSPQILMLSGIGPAAHLKESGVEVAVDLPQVGQGLTDHMSFFQHWRLKESNAGLTLGSRNPLFAQPEFALGVPMDWIVCSDIPKEGLKKAIEKDEGGKPDASKHPLLAKPRAFIESIILYAKLPFPGVPLDADHLTTDVVSFLPTSRGSVSLRSADPADAPKINLNFLATEVDKYVYREGLRQMNRVMLGTEFGKKYIAGESLPEALGALGVKPMALNDTDEILDKRLALAGVTTWHASGSCSMGQVVDSEFRVKGVEGLRVIDASVLPVPLSAHIQAPLYGMVEQAAAIVAGKA